MSIGLRLKTLREKAGYAQGEVAEKLGVDLKTYGLWESDGLSMSLEDAYYCAIALKCTVDEIAGIPKEGSEHSDGQAAMGA